MFKTTPRTSFLAALLGIASVLSVASVTVGGCATSSQAFFGDGGVDNDSGGGQEGGLTDATAEGGDGDGGPSGGTRIACGPTFCRSDAKCVSNACTYDCTGTKVPGDYANITAAVTALAATGADVTLCLGAIQAGESVSISDPGAHNKALNVIATAPLQTTLGSVSVGAGFGDVTLVGFGASSITVQGAAKVTLRGLKISSTSGTALQVRALTSAVPAKVVVDGCDLSSAGTSGYDVYVDGSSGSALNVSVMNSYIHGGQYGIYFAGSNPSAVLSILNNTIDKTQYGLSLSGAPTATVSYVNNIVSNSVMVVLLFAGVCSVAWLLDIGRISLMIPLSTAMAC